MTSLVCVFPSQESYPEVRRPDHQGKVVFHLPREGSESDLPSHVDWFSGQSEHLEGRTYRCDACRLPELHVTGKDQENLIRRRHHTDVTTKMAPEVRRSRHLYTQVSAGRSVSIAHLPLMLLPKVRVYDDDVVDVVGRLPGGQAPFAVVPVTGVEGLHLSAISAVSGWLTDKDPGARSPGSASTLKQRPATVQGFRPRGRDHVEHPSSITHDYGPRPFTVHAILPESEVTSTATCTSDRLPDISILEFPESHSHEELPEGRNTLPVAQMSLATFDSTHDPETEMSFTFRSRGEADDVAELPEHLDSFDEAAELCAQMLRKRQRPVEDRDKESEDEFDDRWHSGHSGHEECDGCPMCQEFARATHQRTGRCLGGAESFFTWMFSKLGKRQEWSRIFKQNRGLTVKGRPHFCNFVNQASLHHRFGRDHSRPFSGHSELSGRSRRSEADHEVVSQWKNNGRLFRRQSGTQGRPGSPSSADDGHIRDDVDLLTEVMGGPTNIQRGGDTDALNNKTIPTVNFPSTPSQQSEPPPGTLRHQTEESRTKSSKDESTSKSSTSAKSKSSKSSSSRGAGKPLPADGQDEAGRDKRQNVSKKGKKCHDRHHSRKGAEGEGGNAPQTEEAAETTKASPEAGENLLDVNVKVPDLPHARTPRRDPGRSPSNKGERRLIPPPSEGRQMLPHELLDLNLYHSTGFDFGDMHASTDDSSKKKQTSWMNDRMALSQQSSRFELPMDMKELEKITPQEYLKSYCIVTSRRLSLYQKVFIKHKDRSNYLNKEGLTQCLKEVLIEMLKDSTLSDLFQLADISEETLIDFRLFSGIAALAERMLYPYYTTVDTADKSEYQRAIIETADFGALSWKLSGVKVTEGTRKLLETLNGCSSVRMEK